MPLHDTHVHLEMLLGKLDFWPEIEPWIRAYRLGDKKVITDILSKKVEYTAKLSELLTEHEFVLQSTVSTDNFDLVTRIFGEMDKIYYLLGSHPEIVTPDFELKKYLLEQENYLKDEGKRSLITGIGEIGLDYFYTQDRDLLDVQKKLFEFQIELASSLNLPVVIHCREAFDDLFAILHNYSEIHGKFLVHCFTGGVDECKKVMELGGKIGIGGVVTFASSQKLVEAVEYAPLESILLETDLPFLAPVPYRGKVCLPEHIKAVAEKVGLIKNVAAEEVLASSKHDTLKLFTKIREKYGEDEYMAPGNKDYRDYIV